MAEPRGFTYPLAPVALKCDWDIDAARTELADIERAAQAARAQAEDIERQRDETRRRWSERLQAGARLDIDAQRMTHQYLRRLQACLDAARAEQAALEAARELVVARLAGLRKFADGLERHRGDAASQYQRGLDQAAFREADDNWVQRSNWRKQA